jgi:hypothetical protein
MIFFANSFSFPVGADSLRVRIENNPDFRVQ